jgi:hypothetical protein
VCHAFFGLPRSTLRCDALLVAKPFENALATAFAA